MGEAATVVTAQERHALEQLRVQLRAWREDQALRFQGRVIIVVETSAPRRMKEAARRNSGGGGVHGQPDVELVRFDDQRWLIVVNSTVIRDLPGGEHHPDGTGRGRFLALALGCTVSDLELAIIDRMNQATEAQERHVLEDLRGQLKTWRHDVALEFHTRAIVVVESVAAAPREDDSSTTRLSAERPDAPADAVQPALMAEAPAI